MQSRSLRSKKWQQMGSEVRPALPSRKARLLFIATKDEPTATRSFGYVVRAQISLDLVLPQSRTYSCNV